jgi:hypothetical protein
MGALPIVLTVIEQLIAAAPSIIKVGIDLKPFAETLYSKLTGGAALTDTERTALRAGVDSLYARLQVPLPAAQPGDPDYVAP